MKVPLHGNTWVGISAEKLPFEEAASWAVLPGCGAVVTFSGVVRDHSVGRQGVFELIYEAYERQAVRCLEEVAEQARSEWSELGRLVLLHRVGALAVSEAAVLVVASAPHRSEAFAAAGFCIDAIKASVPIWKLEKHQDGEDWGLEPQHVMKVDDFLAREREEGERKGRTPVALRGGES